MGSYNRAHEAIVCDGEVDASQSAEQSPTFLSEYDRFTHGQYVKQRASRRSQCSRETEGSLFAALPKVGFLVVETALLRTPTSVGPCRANQRRGLVPMFIHVHVIAYDATRP